MTLAALLLMIWAGTWKAGYEMLVAVHLDESNDWLYCGKLDREHARFYTIMSSIPIAGFLACTFIYMTEMPRDKSRASEIVRTRSK